MKNVPHIVVYFSEPNYDDSPFNHHEFVTSYHEFAKQVSSLSAKFSIVRSMTTYRGGNRFQGGWTYDGKELKRVENTIDADVLLNKGEDFLGDNDCNVVNNPAFHVLCEKDETLRLFPQFFPDSVVVQSREGLSSALEKIQGEKVICKPTRNCGGKGIVIGLKSQIQAENLQFPLLIQEFLDLSAGIPNIVSGLHDLRLVFIGETFSYALIRTPPAGGLMANICQGGAFFTIPEDIIPPEAMKIAKEIDHSFKDFPTRVYSVDLSRSSTGQWYLLELNSPPGLIPAYNDSILKRDHLLLAQHLLRCAQQRNDCSK